MYTKVNGLKIYFQKTGKGKNLIMLHGWGQDVSTFWPVVELLKDKFTLWLVDLPGFGRSDMPTEAFTSIEYANVLAEFIRKNRLRGCTILGHSFGGKIAIKVAALYQNLIDKLILEGSAGIKPDPNFLRNLYYFLAKIIHYFLPNWFDLKAKLRYKFYKRIESDYGNAGKLRKILVGTLKEDLTADLSKVGAETLLIWGDRDRAVNLKYGKRMYRLIKNSKIVILENIGHFPHIKAPERFAYYIQDFI